MSGVVVSSYPAYAAAPELADAVVAGLAASPLVAGLEVPWTQGRVVVPDATPAHLGLVVTAIPHTMATMAAEPTVGLASTDAAGRARAVAMLADVRDQVAEAARRNPIWAVEIHSAPREGHAAEAFATSLAEVAGWDWSGATLVVEHCDAHQDRFAMEKGFLSFADELAVVGAVNAATEVRMGINWARSVIESHDPATALAHVREAASAGLLGATFFSSVSPLATDFGPAWIDAHLPMQGAVGAPEGTLLTPAMMGACVAAARGQGLLGVKVGTMPHSLGPQERVARLLSAAAVLVTQG